MEENVTHKLKILLIGYGRMGHMIERIAQERGHEIVARVDKTTGLELTPELMQQADVAIEFTQPSAAYEHCRRCLEFGLSVVSGTTGWTEGVRQLQAWAEELEAAFFWASNFSIGVYLMDEMNRRMAALMRSAAPEYRVSLEETHHVHKLDAPSGTAITLAEGILSERPELLGWHLADEATPLADNLLPIYAHREGEVAGIHSVEYRSEVDVITLRHEAFGREGFALGAVLAAEFTRGRRGPLSMRQMLASPNL